MIFFKTILSFKRVKLKNFCLLIAYFQTKYLYFLVIICVQIYTFIIDINYINVYLLLHGYFYETPANLGAISLFFFHLNIIEKELMYIYFLLELLFLYLKNTQDYGSLKNINF